MIGIGENAANGKSTLIDVLTGVIPPELVCASDPRGWRERFGLTSIVGKRMNVVAELSPSGALSSEAFNKVIVGDVIDVERKHKDAFPCRPTAGHLFFCNGLPPSANHSNGFWRRLIVVSFNRSFTDDPESDPLIAEKLTKKERAGIFAWLVRGAARLIRQNGYTQLASSEEALQRWRGEADNVRGFLAECCDTSTEKKTPARAVYRSYRAWAKDSGIPDRDVATETAFGRRMRAAGHGSVGSKPRYYVLTVDPGVVGTFTAPPGYLSASSRRRLWMQSFARRR